LPLQWRQEARVARALQASAILVTAVTVVALVLLVVGLALSARPELATAVGLSLTGRDGLAIALAAGAVAIAAAILGHVLSLLRDSAANGGDSGNPTP
jgi:Mg2+/Co2+ transporter CorB